MALALGHLSVAQERFGCAGGVALLGWALTKVQHGVGVNRWHFRFRVRMLVTSWGHQPGWDDISVGWLWAGATGGSSWTAQHQGTSGWREWGLWLRAGSSHVARGLG